MQVTRISYHRGDGWTAPLPDYDSERTLVIAFADAAFRDHPQPLQELLGAYPRSHVIGCSTSGEIHSDAVYDDSLSVAVVRFEKSTLQSAVAVVSSPDESYRAGRELAEQLMQTDGLRAVFLVSDGLCVNGSLLVNGLNDLLPADVVVTGGLAGDGDRFEKTWCLVDGEVRGGVVSAVGLFGDDLRVGHGSQGGWDIFGPERFVTRSEGNVLYEIDGKPALALYKEYLGDRAEGLPATALLFPLAVRAADGQQVVRTILGVDEQSQSMTFAGDIEQGALVQLMRANFDRLIDGAGEAGAITATAGDGDSLSIAISCVGRRLVLGERADEEVEACLAALPAGTQQIGFYSYGEITPGGAGRCDLHNQTMTMTSIRET